MWLKRVSVVAPVVAVMGLVACGKKVPDEELVAKVNGEGITKAQFDSMVERNMARYRGSGHTLPPGIEVRIKESVLRRMIDDEVIAQKAKDIGVSVSDDELNKKFQEHKDRFRTDKAFEDYLKRSNNTEENMKADLRRNMLRDQVVEKLSGEITVTPEEISKYYEDNQQRFLEKEQVQVSRILIRSEARPDAPEAEKATADKKAQAEAKQVYEKAKKAGADFGALAQEHSNGPEKSRRGQLGWLTRGRMPAAFDDVAFSLEPGTVSEPVQTRDGWEIIQVTEKRPERQRTLEDVQESIKNSLLARRRNEKRREVLRELKKTAKVEHLITFDRPEKPGAPTAGPPSTLVPAQRPERLAPVAPQDARRALQPRGSNAAPSPAEAAEPTPAAEQADAAAPQPAESN